MAGLPGQGVLPCLDMGKVHFYFCCMYFSPYFTFVCFLFLFFYFLFIILNFFFYSYSIAFKGKRFTLYQSLRYPRTITPSLFQGLCHAMDWLSIGHSEVVTRGTPTACPSPGPLSLERATKDRWFFSRLLTMGHHARWWQITYYIFLDKLWLKKHWFKFFWVKHMRRFIDSHPPVLTPKLQR